MITPKPILAELHRKEVVTQDVLTYSGATQTLTVILVDDCFLMERTNKYGTVFETFETNDCIEAISAWSRMFLNASRS